MTTYSRGVLLRDMATVTHKLVAVRVGFTYTPATSTQYATISVEERHGPTLAVIVDQLARSRLDSASSS